jgi:hypothetical protein
MAFVLLIDRYQIGRLPFPDESGIVARSIVVGAERASPARTRGEECIFLAGLWVVTRRL